MPSPIMSSPSLKSAVISTGLLCCDRLFSAEACRRNGGALGLDASFPYVNERACQYKV